MALVFCLHVCLRQGIRYSGTGFIDNCELPAMWLVGIEPRSSGRAASALTL